MEWPDLNDASSESFSIKAPITPNQSLLFTQSLLCLMSPFKGRDYQSCCDDQRTEEYSQ